MIFAILSRLARVRFTVGYVAALATVSLVVLMLGPKAHDQVIRYASTNLHNLAHGNIETLWSSAFVLDEGPLYYWWPWLGCLLVLAELHLRSLRLTVAFAVGHMGATLLVAMALAAAVKLGWLPSSISRVSDVGISYGALAVLGALTSTVSRRWRPIWIGWWVSAGLAAAIIGGNFTDAGHTVALFLGMVVAVWFGRPARWTSTRYVLLLVSSVFGFLLLAHTGLTVASGLAAGVLGVLIVGRFMRFRDGMGVSLLNAALKVCLRVSSVR